MLRTAATLTILALVWAIPGTADETRSACDDHNIVAGAVSTRSDVKAFVRCAHEFVQDVGTAEAYRAFHNDERWKSGPIYVFVDELIPSSHEALALVHPIRP